MININQEFNMTLISNTFAAIAASTNGKFFTVTFKKKDGSIRIMNCRTGVTKALKGGTCTVDRTKYLVVYDMHSKAYRSINKDTIMNISVAGEKAAVINC
jgi:hypothetical protein